MIDFETLSYGCLVSYIYILFLRNTCLYVVRICKLCTKKCYFLFSIYKSVDVMGCELHGRVNLMSFHPTHNVRRTGNAGI